MSFVIAAPDMVGTAATDLASMGSAISEAHAAAAAPTTGLMAAGADEVSAAIAQLFNSQGQAYQALGAQAAAFHQQFVQTLNSGAGSYASAEAANASPLHQLIDAANAQSQALFGRPLVGDGADGGPGQNGGPAGILYGNGAVGGIGGAAGAFGTPGKNGSP